MSHEYDSQIKHVETVIKDLSEDVERYAVDISRLEVLKLKLMAYALANKPRVDA